MKVWNGKVQDIKNKEEEKWKESNKNLKQKTFDVMVACQLAPTNPISYEGLIEWDLESKFIMGHFKLCIVSKPYLHL